MACRRCDDRAAPDRIQDYMRQRVSGQPSRQNQKIEVP